MTFSLVYFLFICINQVMVKYIKDIRMYDNGETSHEIYTKIPTKETKINKMPTLIVVINVPLQLKVLNDDNVVYYFLWNS